MYGERIKALRKQKGLKQQEFGDFLKEKLNLDEPIPVSTISSWERVPYPPLEVIVKICKALELDVKDFFADDKVTNYKMNDKGEQILDYQKKLEEYFIDKIGFKKPVDGKKINDFNNIMDIATGIYHELNSRHIDYNEELKKYLPLAVNYALDLKNLNKSNK